MAGLKKDVERLLATLQTPQYGCSVKPTNSGHWRVRRPGYQSISVARSPSDQRALKNIHRDVRVHLGIDLKPQR